jgi:flagellar biosynthesis protein
MNEIEDTPNKVVALTYDGISAPVLSAKGVAKIAEEILAIAREHNIPIREEPELTELLSELKLNQEIPRELYVAVAEVIAFAYMLKGKVPKKNG